MTIVEEIGVFVEIQNILSEVVVSIDLTDVRLEPWCLCLVLLKENLVDSALFLGKPKLKIGLNNREELLHRPKVSMSETEVFLELHTEELDFLLSFFLTYYRDGLAAVRHLDLEGVTDSPDEREVSLIFVVKDSVPPVPSDEARKILAEYD